MAIESGDLKDQKDGGNKIKMVGMTDFTIAWVTEVKAVQDKRIKTKHVREFVASIYDLSVMQFSHRQCSFLEE